MQKHSAEESICSVCSRPAMMGPAELGGNYHQGGESVCEVSNLAVYFWGTAVDGFESSQAA